MQQSCKKDVDVTIVNIKLCRKRLVREKRKKGLKNIAIEFQRGL